MEGFTLPSYHQWPFFYTYTTSFLTSFIAFSWMWTHVNVNWRCGVTWSWAIANLRVSIQSLWENFTTHLSASTMKSIEDYPWMLFIRLWNGCKEIVTQSILRLTKCRICRILKWIEGKDICVLEVHTGNCRCHIQMGWQDCQNWKCRDSARHMWWSRQQKRNIL